MNFFVRVITGIYNTILTILIKLYLMFCRKMKVTHLKNGNNDSVDVIVSLTSYHKRFSSLQWTLESLFQQKTKFSFSVVLILSQEDIDLANGIPNYINNYIDRGMKLIIVKENLKSYKKAFYTADDKIPLITVDDDIFYPNWWLEKLMNEATITPSVVLAYRAHYMLSEKGEITDYVKWLIWSEKNFVPHEKFSLLPTGTSGIYYPPGSLNGMQESKDLFLELCPNADDFWFKYLTVKNGFKSRRISKNNKHFHAISKGDTLFSKNVISGGNDKQFKNLLVFSEDFSSKIKSDITVI